MRNIPIEKGKEYFIFVSQKLSRQGNTTILSEIQPQIWMLLDLNSYIERSIYYYGFYRPWVLPHFTRLLKEGQTVVDVGANVGCYTLWAANIVGSRGSVLSFEPEPIISRKLTDNIRINKFAWAQSETIAIANYDGEMDFFFKSPSEYNRGQGSLVRFEFHQEKQSIRCAKLDTYLSQKNIKKIDVLKIDTQGAEMQVLKGAKETIDRSMPAVLLRCHEDKNQAFGNSTLDIQSFFLERDYYLFEINRSHKKPLPVLHPQPVEDATFIALRK